MTERDSIELVASDLAEMTRFASQLAAELEPGDLVTLSGDLGSGKTTLARELARALGIDASIVHSPTFVTMNVYPNDAGPELVHVDAYRLSEGDDLDALGWDRVLDGTTIALIEWPERIAESLPDHRWEVHLYHNDPGRLITLCPPSGRTSSIRSELD